MTDPSIIHLLVPESSWHSDQQRVAAEELSIPCRHLFATNAKKAIKMLRKHPETAVIVVPLVGKDDDNLQTIAHTVRDLMHNLTVRIVVCAETTPENLDYLIGSLGVNTVLIESEARAVRLRAQLHSELATCDLIAQTHKKHQAEKDLLSAIARFSRLEMKISECLAELARSVCVITDGVCANVVVVRRNGTLKRSAVCYEHTDVGAADFLASQSFPDCPHLTNVVSEARLQLVMQPDDPAHIAASKAFGLPVSGRFIFPLRSFGRTMCLVECWLSEQGLQNTSVELMRAIEKAGEQFSLLFERKQADSQLRSQYKRLKHTLEELTSTRNALYHSEKLASLGQLAAGIAHEINNPVAYVMSNFNPLTDYVSNMSKMLELHAEFMAALDRAEVDVDSELRSQLEQTASELDMDFVMEDVRELVTESREGLERVREIVVNLNQFARKDSIDNQPADLNEAIESTLKLLGNDVKQGISLQLELGEIPLINCQIGLIKQVLLNLFKNGIQSMDGSGALSITTFVEGRYCVVQVKDQGSGIPEAVLEKIFDPFFTTKPVGKGTGLGLSLSHGIIARHNGSLEVVETGEQGTVFKITLPLDSVGSHELPKAA